MLDTSQETPCRGSQSFRTCERSAQALRCCSTLRVSVFHEGDLHSSSGKAQWDRPHKNMSETADSWKSIVQERLQPTLGIFQLSECRKSSLPYLNSLASTLFCSLYYLWTMPQRSILNISAAFLTAQLLKKKTKNIKQLICIQPLPADKRQERSEKATKMKLLLQNG